MRKIEKYIDYLIDGIKAYVDNKINKANFDKTENGQIVAINSNSTYNVKVGKNIYTNVKTLGGTCALNEIVKVVSPQNQPSNMFISKSGGSGGGSSYILPQATSNVLGGIKVGENLTIEGDGTLNGIINVTSDYSTEEHVIGSWIDSKPLYQKTLYGSIATYKTGINVSIPFSHTVVDICGGLTTGATNVVNFVPIGYGGNSYVYAYHAETTLTIQTNLEAYYPYYLLTVKYTKSTD